MTTIARFDLKLEQSEKDLLVRAAALMGTTMAGFMRAAAKEKAQALLERESRITMSKRDIAAFAKALDRPFAPNKALKSAMSEHTAKVRRV